jgi:hypothetical protein
MHPEWTAIPHPSARLVDEYIASRTATSIATGPDWAVTLNEREIPGSILI